MRIEYPNDADLDATGTTAERLLTFEYDGNDRLERILDHPDPNNPGVTDTLGIYRYAGPGLRIAELDLHGDRTDPVNDPTEIEKTVAYDYLRRPTETEYYFTDTAEKREYRETWGDGTWANSPEDTEWVGALRREGMEKVTVDSTGNETVELTHSYVYDASDRLVSFDSGGTTFEYDRANNRSKKNDDTYNHNASNEITDIEDSAQQTLCTFTHDNRGNLTEKDCGTVESFAYDIFNRLVSYESTWAYVYDGLGRRVKKSDGAETHLYLHDGPRVILEVTGSEVREYIHGLGIDEVLMEEIDSEMFWPLVDSLGTVRDLADLDGSGNARVRMEYDYTAYGEVEESDPTGTGLVAQDVLFTGRRLDRESSIYYYRARHYDPELGRFLQRDPIGVWGDVENLGNGYAYVGGDPLNGRDPFGLQQLIEEFDECTNEPVGWPIRICCQYEDAIGDLWQETHHCNPWELAEIEECCPDYGGGKILLSAYEGSCVGGDGIPWPEQVVEGGTTGSEDEEDQDDDYEEDEEDRIITPPPPPGWLVNLVVSGSSSGKTRKVVCCCLEYVPWHVTRDWTFQPGYSRGYSKTVDCPVGMDPELCCSPCEARTRCTWIGPGKPPAATLPSTRPGAPPGAF